MSPGRAFASSNRPALRPPSSSSPSGDGVLASALCVSGALALSIAASGHPAVVLARIAWTPLLIAAALAGVFGLRGLRLLLPWLLGGALLLAVGDTLWQWHTTVDLLGHRAYGPRLQGPLPHPNDAALWAVLLPWTPFWAWPLALGLIAASVSRTAMAGVLIVVVGLTPRHYRLRVAGGLALAFAAYLAWSMVFGHFGQTNGLARLPMWAVGWEMFRGSPLVGQGPGRFFDFYLPVLRTMGPHPFGIDAEWGFIPWAHNLLVEVLAELGLFGLLALSLPLCWAWRQGEPRVRVAMTAFLVMGLVDLTFLKPWVMAVYWGLILLAADPGRERRDVGDGRVHGCAVPAGGAHLAPAPVG